MKEEMVHITDKQGNTHLMLDVQRNFTRFMYDFIEAGADVSAVNKKGKTALDIYKQSTPKKIKSIVSYAFFSMAKPIYSIDLSQFHNIFIH